MSSWIHSPVDCYHGLINKTRDFVRANAPFTFIAYQSLIPTEEDDWINVAEKIAGFVTYRFFINLATIYWSPAFAIVPYLPLLFDLFRIGYCTILESDYSERQPESSSGSRIHTIAFLGFSLFSLSVLQNRLPAPS